MANNELPFVEEVISLAKLHGFDIIHVEKDGLEFTASLEKNLAITSATSEEIAVPVTEQNTVQVKSPCVGYFKSAAENKLGQKIEKGDSVATIAVLGIDNDVEANATGEIDEIYVADGEPVEFGQPLMRIKLL